MNIVINSNIIEKEGITMQEFSVLLYYMCGGTEILNTALCNSLWNKGFLIKQIDGYILDNNKISYLEHLLSDSNTINIKDRINNLADKLRELYPKGKKAGTNYYWRDSNSVISKRLSMFFTKYTEALNYNDEDIIAATKEYITSFNGNYQYMQLLKYFIFKRGDSAGEENSQLLSYLENAGQESLEHNDWTSELR